MSADIHAKLARMANQIADYFRSYPEDEAVAGVHEHIRDVCRRLAKQGYLAIAPELYFRQGDPQQYSDIPTLLSELVGVDVSKQQQTSDWGAANLTDAQLEYAASDVLYLHKLKSALEEKLKREGRMRLAQACFDFLPARAHLDLLGWGDENDIFHH